jgi:hypothetical protein
MKMPGINGLLCTTKEMEVGAMAMVTTFMAKKAL